MKLSIKHTIKVLLLLILLQTCLTAQSQDSINTTKSESDTSTFVMHKSPWGAVLRSALIPGWGQFYNESYIKVPVVWGILGGLVYGWIKYNDDYQYYKSLYFQTEIDRHKQLRNFYRDQRDLFSIYIGLAYILNMVDAYVDAQLFDFTVEQNYITKQPMLGIKFNIQ